MHGRWERRRAHRVLLMVVAFVASSLAVASSMGTQRAESSGTTTLTFDGNGGPVVGGLSDPAVDRALTGDTVVQIAADLRVDALVVGGGGQGGGGGGGGGGGAVCEKVAADGAITLAPGSYTVTVGNGGSGGLGRGSAGGNSSFAGITAPGGGGGAGDFWTATAGGGGGGGNGQQTAPGATVTLGADCYGHAGGSGAQTSTSLGAASGGGGGAGGVGVSGSGSGGQGATWTSGAGGPGRVSVITGATYGGGGGGGHFKGSVRGLGGSGGGGAGGESAGGGSGAAGTGGGGGGGALVFGFSPGGTGGSGVVVVRIPDSIPASVITGANSTSLHNGFRLYWFTTVGNRTMTVTANPNALVTHAGVISGSGNLIVDGPGQLALTSANTFTGEARARSASATLRVRHADALRDATLDLRAADAGAVVFDGADTEYRVAGLTGTRNQALNGKTLHVAQGVGVSNTYSGVLSGGGLRVSGGTLVLTGDSSLTGTSIDAGVLQVGDGGAAGSLGSGAVTNSASLIIDRSGTLTAANAIEGSGSLTKRGSGTLVLTGASTYTGSTTVESGVLRVNGSLGVSAATLQSGTTLSGTGSLGGSVALRAGASHMPGASPGVQTFANGVSYRSGSMLQWELTGNTDAGRGTSFDGVDVTGGVLDVESGVTSALVFNGAGSSVDWRYAFWSQDHQWVVFDNANAPALVSANVFDTVTVTPDSGGRSLAAEQPRAFFRWVTVGSDVVLQYWAPRPLLAGASLEIVADSDPAKGAESVHWDVIGGVLYLYDAVGRDPGDMVVRIGASDLEAKLAAGDVSVDAVSIAGSQPLNLPAGRTLAVSVSAASTYGGALSGGGSLSKAGSGGLTLTAASSHTGGVTVTDGVVVAGDPAAFGVGAVTVSAGAGVDLAGFSVGNAFTVAGSGVGGGGVIGNSGPGAAGLTGPITLSAPATLRGPAGLTLAGSVSGPHALTVGTVADGGVTVSAGVSVAGPLTIGSAAVRFDAGAGGGIGFFDDVVVNTVTFAGDAPVSIAGGRTLTVSPSSASAFGGALSGGGGFVKAGAGTLTLSGASGQLTGGVTVSAGTLVVGDQSALGAGSVTVVSGAGVDVAGFSVANAFTVAGSGVAGGGAIANSGPDAVSLGGTVELTGAATLRGPAGLTLAGAVSGAHALTVGTAVDSGVTVSADVAVAGPLRLGSASVRVDAAIDVAAGRVEFTGAGGAGRVSATANGSLTAAELLVRDTADVFLGAPAQVTVGAFAATGVGRVVLRNTTGLVVGTVAGVSGVSASGRVDLSTVVGDLDISELVTSSVSMSATGVRLAAGTASRLGVAAGGDVRFSGQGAVAATNAITQIFSGSAQTSTGVAAIATSAQVGVSAPVVGVGEVAVAYRHRGPVFVSSASMLVGDRLRLFATTVTGSAAAYSVVSGPCTLDGDVLQGAASGSCVVEAVDGGGATQQQTITVNLRPQRVEFLTEVPLQVSGGVTYTPSASATSGLPVVIDLASGSPQACSLTAGVVTFAGVGTCVIRARQAGDATVAASVATQTVVAGRVNRSVAFPVVDDRAVSSPPFLASAGAGVVGASVTFSASTPSVCSVGEETGLVQVHGAGTCTVTAAAGDVTAVRSFEVLPDPPGRVSITSVTAGDGVVTVGFVPPATHGGSPILGYRMVATPHPDDGGDPVTVDCGPGSPCTVPGLTNGTRYSVVATAFNVAGLGEASVESPEVIPADTSLAVRDLRTSPGDGELRVDWQPPTSLGGGLFVRYDLYVRAADGAWEGPQAITDPDTASHTFTPVTNGVAYDVKVVTITTTHGAEVVANTAKAMGIAGEVPEVPRGLELTELTPTSFMASWVTPLGDGGSPIVAYDVTPTCVFDQPTDTFCVFTAQPRGITTTVNVAAVNLLGSGEVTTAAITLPAAPITALPPLVTSPTTTPPITSPPTRPTSPTTTPPNRTGGPGGSTPGGETRPPTTTPNTPNTVPPNVTGTNRPSGTNPPTSPTANGTGTTVPATPVRPQASTLPPPPPNGPVRLPGAPSVPGAPPRAVIDGRLVSVDTQTRDDGAVAVRVGDVRLTFEPPTVDGPQSSGTQTADTEGSGLVAVEGSGTPLRGDGLMPNSTVQVLLTGTPTAPGWQITTDALAVARIPVAADGTFDGEVSLATSVDQPPVPIGRHVVQIAAFDADGNQVVVETTINIAQHAPRPELDRSVGRTPTPAPGELVATAAGLPATVELITSDDGQGLTADGGDWSLGLQARDSTTRIEPGESGVVVTLAQSGTFTTGGTGLQAGSRADIWMFSEPTLLGSTIVDEQGNFTFDVAVDPRVIGPGPHTLQVQGVAPDGYVRAVNLGVEVEATAVAVAGTTPTSDWPAIAVLVPAVLLAGVILWFFLRRRRNDDDQQPDRIMMQ